MVGGHGSLGTISTTAESVLAKEEPLCQSGVWRALGGSSGVSFYFRHGPYCIFPNGAAGCACEPSQTSVQLSGLDTLSLAKDRNVFICFPTQNRLMFMAGNSSSPTYASPRRLPSRQCMELAPNRRLTTCECGPDSSPQLVLPSLNYLDDMHLGEAHAYVGDKALPRDSFLFMCT